MNRHKDITTFFPVIHQLRKEVFYFSFSLNCSNNPGNSIFLSLPSEFATNDKSIIENSRLLEPFGSRLGDRVICKSNALEVYGKSYQLALIIADKFTRYNSKYSDYIILATGCIKNNKVIAVDKFQDKINFFLNLLNENKKPFIGKKIVFFYPEENKNEELTNLMTEAGIECIPLKSVEQIHQYIPDIQQEISKEKLNYNRFKAFKIFNKPSIVAIATLIIFVFLVSMFYWMTQNKRFNNQQEIIMTVAERNKDNPFQNETPEIRDVLKNSQYLDTEKEAPFLEKKDAIINNQNEKILLESDTSTPIIY